MKRQIESAGAEKTEIQETSKTGLRLVGSEGSWYVTGLSDDAAAVVQQSQLFAVMQPIAGTPDQEAIAVMRAVGPASGSSVRVAQQCLARNRELTQGAGVEVLGSGTDRKVGPCLARVVETGTSERGEDFVVLNVGKGVGVRVGDQYTLLGEAVTADGHAPLGLDTDNDGSCQIDENPMHLKPVTTRCLIMEWPAGKRELKNSFAAWMPSQGR